MPYTKEQYNKQHYQKNKDKKREYYEKNIDKIKQHQKEYRENNKEKIKQHSKEYSKEYQQTPKYKKRMRIQNWKRYGIICDDWDKLYEKYITTTHCELCNVELTDGKRSHTTKCLDHNHDTGLFRNVLCHSCNARRG